MEKELAEYDNAAIAIAGRGDLIKLGYRESDHGFLQLSDQGSNQ